MGIQSPLVLILLLLCTLAGYSLGQCPTKPSLGTHSSQHDQPTKDCEAPESLRCRYASSTMGAAAVSTPSSSDSTDSTTTAMANGATAPPASNEPCPCTFMDEMDNFKILYLNSSQQIIFEICLVNIRLVLIDVTLTLEEKVSKIGCLMTDFFKANSDIKKALKYKKVAGLFRFFQFISSGIQFDSNKMGSLMAIQDSSGANNLTIAIRIATAGDKCGVGSSAIINNHCDRVDKVFKKQIPDYKDNDDRKMGYFKKLSVGNLFYYNPFLEKCVRDVQIKGFGSVSQVLVMAGMFDVIDSVGSTVVNGTAAQCILIQKLQAYLSATSTINSTPPSVMIEANSYVTDLIAYFTQITTIDLRLKFIVSQASNKSEAARTCLYAAPITDDLDLADIHSGAIFSANNNVNTTAGPPSEQLVETVMFESVYNISDVEEGFNSFFDSLNATMQGYVRTYKNAITNCVRKNYPGDYAAKFGCVRNQLQGINSSQNSNLILLKKLLFAVEVAGILIIQVTGSILVGTFQLLCGC